MFYFRDTNNGVYLSTGRAASLTYIVIGTVSLELTLLNLDYFDTILSYIFLLTSNGT